jgi:hypothetical protein
VWVPTATAATTHRRRPVQQEAVERWTAQAAAITEPEAPARNEARPIVADPHEARLVLTARSEAFGERPWSFAAREAWACEAARLVAAGTPTVKPTAEPVGVATWGWTSGGHLRRGRR